MVRLFQLHKQQKPGMKAKVHHALHRRPPPKVPPVSQHAAAARY